MGEVMQQGRWVSAPPALPRKLFHLVDEGVQVAEQPTQGIGHMAASLDSINSCK
jgi:hypothetical protein